MGSAPCTAAWEKQRRLAGIYSFFNGLRRIRLPWRTLCWMRCAGFNQERNSTTCEGWDFSGRAQISEALAEFERASKEDPRHAGAHANLFFSFLTLGDLVKAEEHYQAAHRLDPRLHEIHTTIWVFYERFRSATGKRKELSGRPWNSIPFGPIRITSWAPIWTTPDRPERRKKHFRLAIENRSQFTDAHFQLGLLLQKQGRDEEAVGHFLKTLTLEDERTPLRLYVLAHSYARLGKTDKAIETAVKAREKAFSVGKRELAADVREVPAKVAAGRQTPMREVAVSPARGVLPTARRPAAGRTPLGSLGLAISRGARPVDSNSAFLGGGFPGGPGFQALQRGRRQFLPA